MNDLNKSTQDFAAQWEQARFSVERVRKELGRVIVGQTEAQEQLLISLLCRGHCLIVGVPGLAKTLLISTLAKVLGLKFNRIQFTPDLMPTDIVGSEILQTAEGGSTRRFEYTHGPIFANLILADEINRTPPKTQAALLEAMQEKQVTVAGVTRRLEEPFLVFATQNPVEHEGTYPLPEAQLDRFFFELRMNYPSLDEEALVVRQTTGRSEPSASAVLDAAGTMHLQSVAVEVPLPENVLQSILRLTHATRPSSELADDYVKKYVEWGSGPRASQNLARAARALALLRGQPSASIEEVRAVARPVLRHRIIPNYQATGDGITTEDIVTHLLKKLG
ncbi:MoxR-like ATPase [Roseimicrobium gellanilyticum]|uniref:MoxR-like ATPase n=1 Tax=Roseimicrobium gellanilyticum TaxID=748857 RepID=A0A366HQC0_9BACT|nr:AAA family ATPase [Roseimicrobium gellanilyticum]RBP45049.1 MoxR-like ATPase [Roseimicrobium gellanilyticum]